MQSMMEGCRAIESPTPLRKDCALPPPLAGENIVRACTTATGEALVPRTMRYPAR